MGFCFSCCRSRRSPEQEPLLSSDDGPPTSHSNIDKAVDVLAALNAGKLPSQTQLSHFLQITLRSDVLRDCGLGYGPLSASVRDVLGASREVVEALLQLGLEKNYDDKFQDLMHKVSQMNPAPVHVGAEITVGPNVPVIPNPNTAGELQADTNMLLSSLKSILTLLLTSSAFRLVLSSFLLTARDMFAAVASDIEHVAEKVRTSAQQVERTAKLGSVSLLVDEVQSTIQETVEDVEQTNAKWTEFVDDKVNKDKMRDIVLTRMQEVILRAHQNPKYHQSLRTILLIFRKYAHKLSTTPSASPSPVRSPTISIKPVIFTDDAFDVALLDLKALLERLASRHSLDPVLRSLSAVITDVLNAPEEAGQEIHSYFAEVGLWLDHSLDTSGFITSRKGTMELEGLYDRFHCLMSASPGAQWAIHLRTLISQSASFLSALESDKTTARLFHSLDTLSHSLTTLTQTTVTSTARDQGKWREETIRGAIAWLLPRVTKALSVFPMPRIEFKNTSLDLVLDALLIRGAGIGASLLPDDVRVRNWSEILIGMASSSEPTVDTMTRTQIHVSGLRLAVHEIAYYFAYKGLPITYADEGLLSVDVGRGIGEGLSVDLDVEVSNGKGDASGLGGGKLFEVLGVKTNLPGLTFSIDKSKHYILNTFLLQPLSGPIVRTVLGYVLEQQIQSGLEALEKTLRKVKRGAEERGGEGGAGVGDWWVALLRIIGEGKEGELSQQSESHTTATLKGVIHTTVIQPEPNTTNPPTPEETTIALGGGAQVFPGKGGPYGEDNDEILVNGARVAADDVYEAVADVAGKAKGAVDGAVRVRQEMERAEERREEMVEVERQREGWRSLVFDV